MTSVREHARYKVIDGCPAPRKYAWAWHKLKIEVVGAHGTLYNSIYRGSDAAGILHAHGHHTQAEVIQLHAEGVPGFGPADPVDLSSHCLYNDGLVAPHRPVGSKIPGWECGFDVNDALVPKVEMAIRKLGFHGRRVYLVGSEYHHFNFTRPPQRHHAHRGHIDHLVRLEDGTHNGIGLTADPAIAKFAVASVVDLAKQESLADTEAELTIHSKLF